jgi:hypothetical protein
MVWVSANSTFLFQHPRTKNARVVVDHETGAAVLVGFKSSSGDSAPGAPRAEVPEREYDFGTMNPLTMGKHDFVVRNVGTTPLHLKVGPTTCKCTLAGLAKNELAPGEQTAVTLEWNTGRHATYAHAGTIYTDDPQQKSIELSIRGRVITQLAADLAEIVLPPLNPESAASTDVLIYSQTWDEFEIASVECTLPGVTWEVSPFDPLSAEELFAKAVQRLRLSIPGDLPDGPFMGTVRLTVVKAGESGEHVLELPLHGSVLRRISLLGGKVDAQGNIDLGSLAEGRGNRVRLLVKVRDREPQLRDATITVFPEFLEAKLSPYSEGSAQGLYHLDLEISSTAPCCQYRGNPRGEVRIDTGHPRLGTAKLGVTFAILPKSID